MCLFVSTCVLLCIDNSLFLHFLVGTHFVESHFIVAFLSHFLLTERADVTLHILPCSIARTAS